MKLSSIALLGLTSVLLSTVAAGQPTPADLLTCKTYTSLPGPGSAQPISPVPDLKLIPSYFAASIADITTTSSSSSGTGAGKVSFQTGHVHVPLSRYAEFVKASQPGGAFENCEYDKRNADGSLFLRVDLRLVIVTAVTIVSSSPRFVLQEPDTYVDVTLTYGGVDVRYDSGTGDSPENGGTGSEPIGSGK